jgi:hypothetical protein
MALSSQVALSSGIWSARFVSDTGWSSRPYAAKSPLLNTWSTGTGRCPRLRASNAGRMQMSAEPVGIVDEALNTAKSTLKGTERDGGCSTCGAEEVKGGCDGNGRMIGGLGGVPGFGWWPIKAYRPCPAFVEAGGQYTRKGQSLNEIAFGNADPLDNLSLDERLRGSKKKQVPEPEGKKEQE